jgi:hypothetical protein
MVFRTLRAVDPEAMIKIYGRPHKTGSTDSLKCHEVDCLEVPSTNHEVARRERRRLPPVYEPAQPVAKQREIGPLREVDIAHKGRASFYSQVNFRVPQSLTFCVKGTGLESNPGRIIYNTTA